MEEVEGGGDDEEQEAGGDGMDMKGENIEGQEAHFLQDFPLYIYSLLSQQAASQRGMEQIGPELEATGLRLELVPRKVI